ncbi:uncharacterized protein LOC125519017 [Triticum urartu]|uniref:uncharacterized protein LOC125519017 n=1 Tax=Triticum urartu TaxID=4572 RepID=UPI00204451DC|nr:uncharacterized protein LOC125519017 [Triticum urartu]
MALGRPSFVAAISSNTCITTCVATTAIRVTACSVTGLLRTVTPAALLPLPEAARALPGLISCCSDELLYIAEIPYLLNGTSTTMQQLALDDPDHRHHCFLTSCLHRGEPWSFTATTPGCSTPPPQAVHCQQHPGSHPLTLGVSVIDPCTTTCEVQKLLLVRVHLNPVRVWKGRKFYCWANDGRRSSTLFPFVTQLNSPPRCSSTGPSKSWLQAIRCSAPGCCHLVAGRLTPIHLPLFVYCSLSRLEVIPDVPNASSTSSSKKEAKKKIYLLRDASKFLEQTHRRISDHSFNNSSITKRTSVQKNCRRAGGEGRTSGCMMEKIASSCLDVQDTLLSFHLCSG